MLAGDTGEVMPYRSAVAQADIVKVNESHSAGYSREGGEGADGAAGSTHEVCGVAGAARRQHRSARRGGE